MSYRNSEIRQSLHFVSGFALRVLACAKIGLGEIDAFGVRGIGSVMTARERSVATLASLAFRTHDCVARS